MNIDDALTAYRGDLVAAAQGRQRARARRGRRLLLLASALALAGVIVGTAIATTGWLIGASAPRSVKSDFGSYAPQLGFNPQPGKAVLVASNGAYQLYATTNKQGGYCVLVSAPWKRPGPHGEGGDCSSHQQASVAFWAGIGGVAGPRNGRTILVIDGRTRQAKAASIRFVTPDRNTVTVPVGSSGFFIVGITTQASWCQIGRWAPRVAILDKSGHEISTATGRFGRGTVCSSKPTPTVTPEHGHRVFTLQARPNHYINGYIARARLGDRITCRLAGSTVTLAIPIHRAHTARDAGHGLTLKLEVDRTRDGRVWVLCG